MLSLIVLAIGYVALALVVGYVCMIAVKRTLIYMFGENINITYVDKNGNTQKLRVRANNDDDLMIALRELNANARRKKAS